MRDGFERDHQRSNEESYGRRDHPSVPGTTQTPDIEGIVTQETCVGQRDLERVQERDHREQNGVRTGTQRPTQT